jgi:hypothetical protein
MADAEVKTEYCIPLKDRKYKLNQLVTDSDMSITTTTLKIKSESTRSRLIESITNPSKHVLINENFRRIVKVYHELKFTNTDVILTAFNIIQYCLIKNINDVFISKTGNNELLLYRSKNGAFSNIVIDEDGDVSYIFIGDKPGTEISKYFPKSKGYDYAKLSSML